MLLVADPDRAEGASTHNLEDGQRNGRRELFRNVTGNIHHPRRACTNAPFQVAEVGASAQREPVNRRASQPYQGFCPSSLRNRFGSYPASGGPPLGGRAGERSECFCAFVLLLLEGVRGRYQNRLQTLDQVQRFGTNSSYCRIGTGVPSAALYPGLPR